MRFQIQWKSLCLGLLLTVAGFSLLAAANQTATPVGRFAIQIRDGHAMVLDTSTGQVWERLVIPGSGQTSTNFSQPKVK